MCKPFSISPQIEIGTTITKQENWSQRNNDDAEIGFDATLRLFADTLMAANESVIVQQETNSESNMRLETKVWKQQLDISDILFTVKCHQCQMIYRYCVLHEKYSTLLTQD